MYKSRLIDRLTEEQEDHVFKEINYSRKQLQLDMKLIKEWLKQQKHLPSVPSAEDDQFLELFLTGCKGSLETVKRRLDTYYSVRTRTDIFDIIDPLYPETLLAKQYYFTATMPHTAPTGERIFISAIESNAANHFDHMNTVRVTINRAITHIHQAGVSSRIYIMFDVKGLTAACIAKLSPQLLRDSFLLLEKAIAVRILKLSFINVNRFAEIAINNLIIPVLSTKLSERVQICSKGLGDVHKYFSPKILPRDYGGDSCNPTLKEYSEKWNKFEEENRSWFLNELSGKVDESKRVKTDDCLSSDSFYGVHGTLKKLVID